MSILESTEYSRLISLDRDRKGTRTPTTTESRKALTARMVCHVSLFPIGKVLFISGHNIHLPQDVHPFYYNAYVKQMKLCRLCPPRLAEPSLERHQFGMKTDQRSDINVVALLIEPCKHLRRILIKPPHILDGMVSVVDRLAD